MLVGTLTSLKFCHQTYCTCNTCVLRRHDQKSKLNGLGWKQKLNWHSRVQNHLFSSVTHIFRQYIYFVLLLTVISPKRLDIISKLRVRPKYQLSSYTKFVYKLPLSLILLRFLFKSTNIGYTQRWWATFNQFQSGYNVMLLKAKTDPKIACFWQGPPSQF